MTAGNMLLEAAAAAGYYGLMTRTSGPQIRGGEAAAMVRVAAFPTDAQDDRFHVLAAIDWQNVQRFAAEIPLGAGQRDRRRSRRTATPPEVFLEERRALRAGAAQDARQAKIQGGWPNMVALGVLAGADRPARRRRSRRAVRKSLKKSVEPGLAAVRVGMAQAAALRWLSARGGARRPARAG